MKRGETAFEQVAKKIVDVQEAEKKMDAIEDIQDNIDILCGHLLRMAENAEKSKRVMNEDEAIEVFGNFTELDDEEEDDEEYDEDEVASIIPAIRRV